MCGQIHTGKTREKIKWERSSKKRRRVPTCSLLRKSAHASHSSSCIILSFQGTTAATNVFSHTPDCESRGADHSSCHNETAIKSVKYNHRGEKIKVVEVIQSSVYVPTVCAVTCDLCRAVASFRRLAHTHSVTKEMACMAEWGWLAGFRHAAATAGFTPFTLPSALDVVSLSSPRGALWSADSLTPGNISRSFSLAFSSLLSAKPPACFKC